MGSDRSLWGPCGPCGLLLVGPLAISGSYLWCQWDAEPNTFRIYPTPSEFTQHLQILPNPFRFYPTPSEFTNPFRVYPTPSEFTNPFRFYPPPSEFTHHLQNSPTTFIIYPPPSEKIGFGAAGPFCTLLDLFVDPQNVDFYKLSIQMGWEYLHWIDLTLIKLMEVVI